MAKVEGRRARRRLAVFALLLALLALIALVAIPATVAKYVGSHTWINPPKCKGCHKDIRAETLSSTLRYSGQSPHNKYVNQTDCIACHGGQWIGNMSGHRVEYGDCVKCHKTRQTGLANWTWVAYINSSSHGPLVWKNSTYYAIVNGTTTYPGGRVSNSSLGCMVCHTGMPVSIEFQNKTSYFNITYNVQTESVSVSTGGWNKTKVYVTATDKQSG